jgi:hypothetical protein
MKKLNQRGMAHLLLLALVVVSVALVGVYLLVSSKAAPKTATTAPSTEATAQKTTGNGAPNGAHFNLNIIGVPKEKTAEITSGNRIFVPLEGVCKINLTPGDFSVLDGNCTDNSPAAFQLPNPDPDGDGNTDYTVWARPLGKPGGKATATTCATDPTTGEEVCSLESSAFVRNKGKSSFENVSKGFLTILYDDDGDAATPPIRVSIFDERLQDYFWNYDNKGLKVLQLRFYQK